MSVVIAFGLVWFCIRFCAFSAFFCLCAVLLFSVQVVWNVIRCHFFGIRSLSVTYVLCERRIHRKMYNNVSSIKMVFSNTFRLLFSSSSFSLATSSLALFFVHQNISVEKISGRKKKQFKNIALSSFEHTNYCAVTIRLEFLKATKRKTVRYEVNYSKMTSNNI